jgi:hypothetical protein
LVDQTFPHFIHRTSVQSDKWYVHENDDTLRKYSQTHAKFIHASLISALTIKAGDTDGYRLPLSDGDVEQGLALVEELKCSSSDEEKLAKLHAFSYSLLSTNSEERPGTTKWEDPLQCFLALLFLRQDGSFAPARGVSPNLSHCKYILRHNSFYEAYDKRHLFKGDLSK